MNRVILCGPLTERPHLAFTPCGVAVAHWRLHVPRPPRAEGPDVPKSFARTDGAFNARGA
jgi:hypothetical protein